MSNETYRYGFRILGPCSGERRLVDAAAFGGYAQCDPRAEIHREAYLSAFQFGGEFAEQLRRTGTTKGYSGTCWTAWLWFDIDRDSDLPRALDDTRRLVVRLTGHYGMTPESLLVFFSGAKGFHVGIPSALWTPEPGTDFHTVARRMCEAIADSAGVVIDSAVYDRVRAFRAPNSLHPRTGLHKRHIDADAVLALSASAVLDMARLPEPFEMPAPDAGTFSFALAGEWEAARNQVSANSERTKQRRNTPDGAQRLNRATLEFIRDGAANGERHIRLYSAAANLREFNCPVALAHALLTESALDSGMTPTEVRRQIECGLNGGAA
ncbi:MAG: DNA primase [Candidatus Hydrogenedentes bacterium]|nr:DNA primase [Candidatus Hydrogenedentota bacterium]